MACSTEPRDHGGSSSASDHEPCHRGDGRCTNRVLRSPATAPHCGTNVSRPRIAVALDRYAGWHEGFASTLEREKRANDWFDFDTLDLDRNDWTEQLEPFNAVLWKSSFMGPAAAAHFKEKIFFLETHLKKLVFPNFKT